MFKSKHKLDLSLVSMDQRLDYHLQVKLSINSICSTEVNLCWVTQTRNSLLWEATILFTTMTCHTFPVRIKNVRTNKSHKSSSFIFFLSVLKTGASGMIAYRFQKKDGEWQWLQTSSRLVYKNSKPDFVICTHRQLMEEEGRDLLGKRTMDFKVSLRVEHKSLRYKLIFQFIHASSG